MEGRRVRRTDRRTQIAAGTPLGCAWEAALLIVNTGPLHDVLLKYRGCSQDDANGRDRKTNRLRQAIFVRIECVRRRVTHIAAAT